MGIATLKHARMELKTTEDVKDRIVRAAALLGIDATAFVLGPAAERAQQVIAIHGALCTLGHAWGRRGLQRQ